MGEKDNVYNPQRRNLGLAWAGKVGRRNLAVSLGVDPEDLDILLDTEVAWPEEVAEALLVFVERRERQKNGAVGVGPGETMWEFKHRTRMEEEWEAASEGEAASRVGGDDLEGGASPKGSAAEHEWALPGTPVAEKVDGVADPEMLEKAAHVLDLCALLDAGRRRLWDPEVSDRAWREISEVMCRLELVLIMDFSTDPGGSMEEWDRWRCQREADVRWNRLRELRRAMDQGGVRRTVRWLLGRKKRDWLAVLMRDVDGGGMPGGLADDWGSGGMVGGIRHFGAALGSDGTAQEG